MDGEKETRSLQEKGKCFPQKRKALTFGGIKRASSNIKPYGPQPLRLSSAHQYMQFFLRKDPSSGLHRLQDIIRSPELPVLDENQRSKQHQTPV
ncbi:hypothetical protein F2Q70_00039490 [Brassica cretica]|uniref:Uncharacterized protein n=1 Tax=Brassica cretica TaxID=69181 RepID=A0A3N6Q8U4_BRACR|nr:hypothetical protein F2Q70_00039490 [Brassica cretica]KAF3606856.1 hypothetical protein DY000_02050159 [Brassica cretica]